MLRSFPALEPCLTALDKFVKDTNALAALPKAAPPAAVVTPTPTAAGPSATCAASSPAFVPSLSEFEPQSPRPSEASTACPSSCEPQWPRTSGATQTAPLQRASGTLRAARDAWHPHGSGCDTQIAVFPGDMLGVEWRQSPEEGGFWAWGLNIKQQTFGYFPIACLDI